MILRAIERLDPRSLYGRSWKDLTYPEQIELLGFSDIRDREEAKIMMGLRGGRK